MTQQWPGNDPYAQNPQAGPWGQQARPWGAPNGSPWGAAPQQGSPWGAPQQGPFQGQQVNPYLQYQQAPARRRGNPVVRFIKAALLLTVLGFVGLVALGMWVANSASSGGQGSPAPTAQATVATSPEQPAPVPSASSTPSAASTPTSVPTSQDGGSYQNDSYQVPAPDPNPPALPEPETYQEATQLMRANPVYHTSVPRPVRCQMNQLDLQTASKAQLTTHLNEMMGCLMRVWSVPLKDAGFEAVRPTVTVYSGSVSTRCGKLPDMNAVYCGADQQVYYAQDLPMVVPRSLRGSRFVTESVIAHEFGHAVQARSAILISEQAWEEKVTDKSAANELSRRLEQQADCFAGEFLGSIQQSTNMTPDELGNVTRLFYSIGDDVLSGRPGYIGNHGQGADRQAWITKGMQSTSVGACNTFTAPASQVR